MRCYGWIFICYGCFKTQWQPWIKCNVSINNHKTQICRTLLVELSSWETCAVSQFFKLFQMPKKSLLKSRYTKNIIATLSYPKNIRIKNFASLKILWSSPSLETFKVLPPPPHTTFPGSKGGFPSLKSTCNNRLESEIQIFKSSNRWLHNETILYYNKIIGNGWTIITSLNDFHRETFLSRRRQCRQCCPHFRVAWFR